MNWAQIAKRDQELRLDVENASERLAEHRWKNTIDAGVAFREYAKKVGVSETAVRNYAKAWEVRSSASHSISMSDALVKAETSEEQYDVIQAVATARGTSAKTVLSDHKDEVRRIRHIAQDRAEVQGTTVAEEAEKVATAVVRSERADQRQRERRRSHVDHRFIELETHLLKAKRALMAAAAVDLELTDEYTDLIAETLGSVKKALGLVEMRFIEAADIDWDTELAKLADG
jgi:hypothetical protein